MANPLDVEFGGIARLVGYEIPQRLYASADPVPFTLYWEALDDGRVDFTIFTHMLAADGQLIGQHDAKPVNGTRPTSTWLHGEFLDDPHVITLDVDKYQGQAQIKGATL